MLSISLPTIPREVVYMCDGIYPLLQMSTPLNLYKSVSIVLITAVSPNLSSFISCTLQSNFYMIRRITLKKKSTASLHLKVFSYFSVYVD